MFVDWGEASTEFDKITEFYKGHDLSHASEAETRFKVIDRILRDVLNWSYEQIQVEERTIDPDLGYIDYSLRDGDRLVIVEAKRSGTSFPTPTVRPKLKLSGTVLGQGPIRDAIEQADKYATDKNADVVVVTNGACWIFYPTEGKSADSYAYLLFPFTKAGHAEKLFDHFALANVSNRSLDALTSTPLVQENRLISVVRNPDYRLDRNSIANSIMPAVNAALHADALVHNVESLKRCFVTTEARTKFDTTLGMFLADPKPFTVQPARKIRIEKGNANLNKIIDDAIPSFAPPVTLIIGPVGAGKSTYLKHFELISGQELLAKKSVHWIYIDFEKLGPHGNPRELIYKELLSYIEEAHENPITYAEIIEPAYQEKIAGLLRTKLAPIADDEARVRDAIFAEIDKDYAALEPYVDRILKFVGQKHVCVIVLDNVDLYEDAALETKVFAEGLALSKRIFANVIVSIRDTTFVKHQSDSTFDAYQLQKFWLNPPDFKAVLSSRLSYSKVILQRKATDLILGNGMYLHVPDLSVFFDIVQKSVLSQEAGDFIEAVADMNIRKGLTLVNNFLASGHINADTAIKNYIQGDRRFVFPFHEVFKGTLLSQWKYYQEAKAYFCPNIFDARLASNRLQLLRLHMLQFFVDRARNQDTLEVKVGEVVNLFSQFGASEKRILECLTYLRQQGLIDTTSAEPVSPDSTVRARRTAGYFIKILARKFVYVESCLYDTAIERGEVWEKLEEMTELIEGESNIADRMRLRKDRIVVFLDHLCRLEKEIFENAPNLKHLGNLEIIRNDVLADTDNAVTRSQNIMNRRLAD